MVDLSKLKNSALMAAAILVLAALETSVQPVLGQTPPADAFEKLHQLMAPGPKDAQWMQVPWMPSSNIYAARKKAADEGKPLLLWYMAGEPLGTC